MELPAKTLPYVEFNVSGNTFSIEIVSNNTEDKSDDDNYNEAEIIFLFQAAMIL